MRDREAHRQTTETLGRTRQDGQVESTPRFSESDPTSVALMELLPFVRARIMNENDFSDWMPLLDMMKEMLSAVQERPDTCRRVLRGEDRDQAVVLEEEEDGAVRRRLMIETRDIGTALGDPRWLINLRPLDRQTKDNE